MRAELWYALLDHFMRGEFDISVLRLIYPLPDRFKRVEPKLNRIPDNILVIPYLPSILFTCRIILYRLDGLKCSEEKKNTCLKKYI